MENGNRVRIINTGDIWEGMQGTIIDISDREVLTVDGEDLTEVTVEVDFSDDHKVAQVFPKENLEIITNADVEEELRVKKLTEDLEPIEPDEDFINDYVYFIDIDDNEIPSWYFVSKIATAENVNENTVVDRALKLKYKIYRIEGKGNAPKLIVLAPKTKLEDVYADYIDYIPGTVTVTEVN